MPKLLFNDGTEKENAACPGQTHGVNREPPFGRLDQPFSRSGGSGRGATCTHACLKTRNRALSMTARNTCRERSGGKAQRPRAKRGRPAQRASQTRSAARRKPGMEAKLNSPPRETAHTPLRKPAGYQGGRTVCQATRNRPLRPDPRSERNEWFGSGRGVARAHMPCGGARSLRGRSRTSGSSTHGSSMLCDTAQNGGSVLLVPMVVLFTSSHASRLCSAHLTDTGHQGGLGHLVTATSPLLAASASCGNTSFLRGVGGF